MEPLSSLLYLLEPACIALICTAWLVVLASAHRALSHEKESERHRDLSESSITLDTSQAIMIPIASSCSLLLMFYLFASVSQLVTAFTAIAAASSLAFCLSPLAAQINSKLGLLDTVSIRCCCGHFTRVQLVLTIVSTALVATWLVSGHWVLNNVLGIAICIAFVSHVRIPNIRICALLLICLFAYDIFWVFFSERFFGANVMVSVATQQAQNPMHTVAHTLHLPVSQTITKKLDLPVKILVPRNLWRGDSDGSGNADFMMLGLGDMAIPAMLLALVLCFDHRKERELSLQSAIPHTTLKRFKYVWFAAAGYALGLIAALAGGILSRAPQPALLYLVPSTLGPVSLLAWAKEEFTELWDGPKKLQKHDKGKAKDEAKLELV